MTIPSDSDGWFKSTWSADNANCVEVCLGSSVGVRDTKARTAGVLTVPAAGWSALVAELKTQQ
jgi:hypothetical protein